MSERRPSQNGDLNTDVAALSWPVAAGIISGLLLVVLGGGWLLARTVRPAPGGVAAQATTSLRAAATAKLTAAPPEATARQPEVTAAPPGTASTLTAPGGPAAATTPSVAGTPPAAGTPAAAATPAAAPTIAHAGATAADTTVSAGATVVSNGISSRGVTAVTIVPLATPQPTPTPRGWWDASSDVPENQRVEVEQAYVHFWDVRTQALLELDPNRLTEIMAGTELTAEQQAIKDLQASGRAQRVDVEHHELIAWATSDAATVLDEYVSHTVLVDAATKEPVEDPPSAPFRVAYLFRKVDGRWLAVDAVRVTYAQ
jgi:hypothetical protein